MTRPLAQFAPTDKPLTDYDLLSDSDFQLGKSKRAP